jgi:large subunit ribosomal protein L21
VGGEFAVAPQAAFAVFQLGNFQYKASPDDVVYNMKLKGADVNDIISLDRVLLAGSAEGTVIGRPFVPGACVLAVVEAHFRDAKVEVFKFKRRKGYRKHRGHRAQLTALRILEVRAPGMPPSGPAPGEPLALPSAPPPARPVGPPRPRV